MILRPDRLGLSPDLSLPGCMTLGKPCTHLYALETSSVRQIINSNVLHRVVGALNVNICEAPSTVPRI